MIGSVQLDVTAPVSLEVGDTYTLTARALDTGGTVLPTVLFVWSTSDAEVATVTAGTGSTGIVSAIGVGTARITAAAAGRTATVDVIVTAAADPTDGGG
ncbi:MAG: Ig-like domain-containing protein [Gemmatimonadota bacterium]